MLIEGGLTAVLVSLAFLWPKAGSGAFAAVERPFVALARHRGWSIAVVGSLVVLLRLATLPVNPIPHPFVHDDFSFLLAANTFASGRLTNPTPALWTHFESFHIDMRPSYMSMYFPAQGMLLAAGKIVTGNAWFGLLAVTALMCAVICWMLQAWLPLRWALLGGLLAALRLGLFSYWIDTYSGGGSIAALGGALVLGALPRLMKTGRQRYALLMAVGIAVLANSRPFEGMLLCIPVAAVLAWWVLFGKNRPQPQVLLRRAVAPIAILIATGVWMGYYNYRVFGNPLTLPYTIDRETYAVAPYFIWQSPRPEPVYRHREIKEFYTHDELQNFTRFRTIPGFIGITLLKPLRALLFFAGIALLPPLIMWRRVLLDRRIRFLVLCLPLLIVGMAVELWLIPHYLAPFTAIFYAIGLQAMRHLRLWAPGSKPVGAAIVRFMVAACVVLGVMRLYAQPLNLRLAKWPGGDWAAAWYGPGELGVPRAQVEAQLKSLPGRQLAIVRYSANHNCLDEWVYNAPDIADAKVIWARDMGAAQNQELIDAYKGRKVWLVQPDLRSARVSPYKIPEQGAGEVAAAGFRASTASAGNRAEVR